MAETVSTPGAQVPPTAPVVPPTPPAPAAPANALTPATPPAAAPDPASPATPAPVDPATPATTAPPIVYALTVPAGAEAWLEPSDLQEIEALARTKGWTPEIAQEALNDHADALVAQSAKFRATLEADPQYGGDQLSDTQRLATAALDRVRPAGTPHGDALRRVLQKTGYGNHVEVVSFLADLGKLMAEDRPIVSGSTTPPRDAATVLYGGGS